MTGAAGGDTAAARCHDSPKRLSLNPVACSDHTQVNRRRSEYRSPASEGVKQFEKGRAADVLDRLIV